MSEVRDAVANDTRQHYGYIYSKDRNVYLVDQEAAGVVKEIFSMYFSGTKYSKIAKELNDLHIDRPDVHKAKLFGYDLSSPEEREWNGDIVENILTMEIYKGVKEEKDDGETRVIVPAIIGTSMYDKVQKKISASIRRKRGSGTKKFILAGRVYDKDTGKELAYRTFPDPSTGIFYDGTAEGGPIDKGSFEEKLTDEDGRRNFISLKDILDAGRKVLDQERNRALNVWRHLEADVKEKDEASYRKEANELFSELSDLCSERMKRNIAHDNKEMSEETFLKGEKEFKVRSCENEKKFWLVMAEKEGLEGSDIAQNKWLKLYCNIELPEVMSQRFLQKYVERIDVENFQKIEITLKDLKWKEKFPEEWLSPESEV